MASIGTATLDVKPDLQGAQQAARGPIAKLGSSLGGALALGVGAVAVGAIGKQVGDAVLAAQEAASAAAITDQIIQQTGGIANVTSQQLSDLNTQLSLRTGIDDELIRSGQNVLLTFKNIRNEAGEGNDVFDQASGLMLDLATVFGGDASSAATQLGKALDDPIKGVTALRRVGVSFTEQQQEQIKTLVESGDTLAAQKIILGELESQVGGTAEASADSTAKIGNAFAELQESLGAALLPLVDELAPIIVNDIVPALQSSLIPAFQRIGAVVVELVPYIARLLEVGLRLLDALILPLLDPLLAIIDLFFVLAEPILLLVADIADALMPILTELIGILIDALRPAIEVIAALFKGPLGQVLVLILSLLKPILPVISFLAKLLGAVLGAAVKLISGLLSGLASFFTNMGSRAAEAAGKLRERVVSAVQAVIQWFRELPGRILSAIGNMGRLLLNAGRDLIAGFINGIKKMAGSLISAIKGTITNALPGFVKKALGIGSPSRLFAEIGSDVGAGMVIGLESMAGDVQAAADAALVPSVEMPDIAGQAAGAVGSMPPGGTQIILQEGAVQVNNPAPEPASTSTPRELRKLAATLGRA